jgi:hypothetical protein
MAKLKRPTDFRDTRQLPRDSIIIEIGRIAIVSASIEDLLHSLYWRFAGLTETVGSVITGDARASRLTEDVIKIARVAKVDQAIIDDLKDIFADYALLATERNKFVHWIWSWNTKTHEDRIDPPSYKPTHQGKYVTTESVAEVADDLVWIEHRLSSHLMTKDEINRSLKEHGPAGAPDAPTPWLQKPNAPNPKQLSSPDGKK